MAVVFRRQAALSVVTLWYNYCRSHIFVGCNYSRLQYCWAVFLWRQSKRRWEVCFLIATKTHVTLPPPRSVRPRKIVTTTTTRQRINGKLTPKTTDDQTAGDGWGPVAVAPFFPCSTHHFSGFNSFLLTAWPLAWQARLLARAHTLSHNEWREEMRCFF